MTSVLFVDDEPETIDDLSAAMSALHPSWAITVVSTGSAALTHLQEQPVDIVISDMRMPVMDGATLLAQVRREYPDSVRLILSSNTELASAIRTVPVAHQFLAKPCSPDLLNAAIMRATELQSRLVDPQLRSLIGKLDTLPSPPAALLQLNDVLQDPMASIEQVARILARDPAMTAKLLQLVNSAFFGLSHPVTDVREAVLHLGIATVRNLLAASEIFRSLPDVSGRLAVQRLHDHSLEVAHLARELVSDSSQQNDAFAAGLLHDVGMLIAATQFPDSFAELQARHLGGESITSVEVDILGARHSDIGAYLLTLWGLPFRVIEAVARHHDAGELDSRDMDLVHAVYIAQMLVDERGDEEGSDSPLSQDYLDEMGVSDWVAGWRALRGGNLY